MDLLAAIGLSLFSMAGGSAVAQIAKARRWLRVGLTTILLMASAIFLIASQVLETPQETAIRTYLAFPLPGERFKVVPGQFPDIFTDYKVPAEPDTLRISSTEQGRCAARSEVILGRDDAWRCVTHSPSRTLDPCFRNVFKEGQLLCVESPWADSGIAFDLTEPLPSQPATELSENPTPWAIETDGGVRCVERPGSPVVIGNLSFTYECRTGDPLSPEGLLSHDIDQHEPLWTTYLAEGAGRDIESVGIAFAWY